MGRIKAQHIGAIAALALAVLFVVSWFAPLLRAGLLPLFGLSEISIISGLQTLWASDPALALLVTFLSIFAPMLKLLGTAMIALDLMHPKLAPVIATLGKAAMAEVFLIALYIVVVKGIGIARVEVAWGLYLFTFCILAALVLGRVTKNR